MKDFSKITIREINKGLLEKDFSALELAEYFINEIKTKNNKENIFSQITEKLAQEQAREIDKKIAKKEPLSLIAGLPIAIKDNILVEGVKCESGSIIMKDYVSLFDATVIEKIKKQGAIILGKTNASEFGLNLSNQNFDKTALAISQNMCISALGTDVGGEIRQLNDNIVGLRPTYGSVSRYGLVSTSSSLEQIGPLAKNIEDLEIIYKTIAGKDSKDFTSKELIDENQKDFSKLKIGIPKECFSDKMNLNIRNDFSKLINFLKEQNFEIEEIDLPLLDYALIVYLTIMSSEIFSELAKFDGIRYGQSKRGKNLLETYNKSRGEGFSSELKKIMILGAYVLSAENYNILYKKAQKIRMLIKRDFQKIFEKIDIVITPTLIDKIESTRKLEKPSFMNSSNDFMSIISLAGLPSVSMPFRKDESSIRIQVIGNHFNEKNIFKICKNFEII